MSCNKLEHWVMAEGAGNLPSGLLDHAARCERCRRLIEDIRTLDRSISGTAQPDPGDVYWGALSQRIASRLDEPMTVISYAPATPTWRRVVARVWAPAVAIALLAIIASRQSLNTFSTSSSVRPAARVALPSDDVRDLSGASNEAVRNEGASSSLAQGGQAAKSDALSTKSPSVLRPQIRGGNAARATSSEPTMSAKEEFDVPVGAPTIATNRPENAATPDDVWPERQVTIMGKVDSNLPTQPLLDEKKLTTQDAFSTYERQMAQADQGMETVGTSGTPGRLMAGSAPAVVGRGAERETPVEKMRQFDEMAELHDLIARLGSVPAASRTVSQWTQLSTAWFRLGMISDRPGVIDSALSALTGYMVNGVLDSTQLREWDTRKSQLENRRRSLRP